MLNRNDILEYYNALGKESALNLLLLCGPDGFDGDYFEMSRELNGKFDW